QQQLRVQLPPRPGVDRVLRARLRPGGRPEPGPEPLRTGIHGAPPGRLRLPRPVTARAGHDPRRWRGGRELRRRRLGVGRSLEDAQGLAALLGHRPLIGPRSRRPGAQAPTATGLIGYAGGSVPLALTAYRPGVVGWDIGGSGLAGEWST